MKQSEIRERAKQFAIKVISVCDRIADSKSSSVLINQIVKSSTSIGANIHEANYAQSKADFINKLQISLKECFETEYWIEMLQETQSISEDIAKMLMSECGTIRRLLVKSINTAKQSD